MTNKQLFKPTTKNGYKLDEVTSALQKDIRRQNTDSAIFWAMEFLPFFHNYLWKRLVVISAEDIEDPQCIYQIIERIAVNARDAGTPMFSVSDIPDPRKYSRNKPFTLFKTQKIGMYGLFLDNDLRYDERFVLQEDVDLCLQVLLKYRYVWTDCRYSFYGKPVMGNKGGCASFRNQATESKMHELLKKKWGYDRFTKTNSKRVQSYTLNIVNPFRS